MKKLVLMGVLGALCACNQVETAPAETEQAAAPEPSGLMAWELNFEDGTKGITVATADGRYFHAAGNFQSGTMETDEGTGRACFTAEGASDPVCVVVEEQEDGSFKGAVEDGTGPFTSTVIK